MPDEIDIGGAVAKGLQPLAFPGPGRSPGPALMTLRDVTVTVGRSTLLDGICLDLAAGAPTLVMGPNGSGKTTLLRLAMALRAPSHGMIDMRPDLRTAFVFQRPVMLRRSSAANVAFARAAANFAADAEIVAGLLAKVGLDGLANRPARKLSGGEQQRLALARALAREPDVLFLDEPTASLDPAATKAVEEIVGEVAAAGVKVVMATHDIGQARRLAGDVVFLVRGRIVEHAPGATFFTSPATEAAKRFLAGDLVL